MSALLTACALTWGCEAPEVVRPTPTIDPLTLSCPSSTSKQAESGQTAAPVTYAAPVASGGILPIETQCAPASGSSFQVGTTQVQCTATDGLATVATCGFSVVVQPPLSPPRLSATSFMAFGDSLTEGKVSLTFSPWMLAEGPAYSIKLEALLRQRYTDQIITVANEGLGGTQASDPTEIQRLDRALDSNRPAVLLLMDGANDLLATQRAAIAGVISGLDTMIDRASGRGIQIFLASLPPQVPDRPRSQGQPYVVPLNDQIKALAQSRRVTFVDVYDAFHGDLSLVGSDGLHLTEAGYDVVARAFYDQIVATLEVSSSLARRNLDR